MAHPGHPKNIRRILLICGLLSAAILVCAAILLVPEGSRYRALFPRCFFYEYTGLYCPGCGNTRALSALLHGNLVKSLRYNILLMPFAAVIGLLLWKPRLSRNPRFTTAIAASIIAFMILRNLPWMPFTLLAPPH